MNLKRSSKEIKALPSTVVYESPFGKWEGKSEATNIDKGYMVVYPAYSSNKYRAISPLKIPLSRIYSFT